jgi:hypothetical protein
MTRAFLAVLVIGAWSAQGAQGVQGAQGAQSAQGAEVDLASAEMGGRVEWASSQNSSASGGGAAMNLIATTPRHYGQAHEYGWTANGPAPQEIVFSFYSRQIALVAGVLVNPLTPGTSDRPKEVEIWVSVQSPLEGFTKVAAATLKNEDSLQPIAFAPTDARFVKLRVVSTYAPIDSARPGDYRMAARRVRILEGERAGYASMLSRNPELAAVAKGVIPTAPPAAALPVTPTGEPTACAVPRAEAPKPSTFPQSKQVLVIAAYPDAYRTIGWKPSAAETSTQPGRPVVPGVNFMWMPPSGAAPAHLIAEPKVDTVVFAQVCELSDVSAAFKQALLAWIAAGHKLIVQDSDFCAASRTPKYDFLPYPFATVNPGAFGAKGEAGVLENSTLASANPKDKSFVDTDSWKAGPNDLGDSNIVVQYDARWCGAMWAKNRLQKNGMALAYARYGRGLIIYNGFDADQINSRAYQHLATNELLQPFDGDYLPCSQPLADFIITARPEQKSRPMAAGRTYTYPISVLGNFGYSGRVTLDAAVVPADPGVTVKLDTTAADLTKVDEASTSLTVTASPTASPKSRVISVRGKDANGKSNVLCLALPERTTGGLTVLSGLRKDKTPTKNLEIILDASGSMKLPLGKKTRWATAQDVLKDVVAKLPDDFSVGLRTYGHRAPSTSPKTCTDTELVVPVAPLNRAGLLATAAALRPRGETPLVYSALQTPADLKAAGGGTVILITDGEESCKGDFAAAAKTLKDNGLNVTLNIVGFTLKAPQARAQLGTLAESTGGHYYGAQNGTALARAVLLAAVNQFPYRILDAKGTEVDKGVAGVDDKHELPPGDYTLVVNAGDESLTVPVTLALRQDVSITVGIKDDKLVVER